MSVSLMYVFAIVVGFVGGVLNCLIMACTGDPSHHAQLVHVSLSRRFWSKTNNLRVELRVNYAWRWICWRSANWLIFC